MSGFGTIISFVFVMFISLGAMTGTIYMYNDQVIEQDRLQKEQLQQLRISALEEIEIESISYSSRRLILNIKNIGNEDFEVVRDGRVCFDVFVDSNFVLSELIGFTIDSKLAEGYSFIGAGEEGRVISYPGNITNSSDMVFISCSGKRYEIDLRALNFDNSEFRNRALFSETPNSGIDQTQSLDLKISDINHSLVDSNEVQVLMDVNHLEDLVLNLDVVSQEQLDETGTYTVVLGDSNSVEGSDGSNSNGIVLEGLDFDLGEKLTVENFNLDERSTLAFWFKPSSDLSSSSDQINFSRSGNDYAIVFNQENDGRIGFYTYSAPGVVDFSIKTVTNEFNMGEWYHVAFVFDNSNSHRMYLNSNLESTSGVNLNLPGGTQDLEIGNLN